MRGRLRLCGASILAWIDGMDLMQAIEGEWVFLSQDKNRVVFKVEVPGYGVLYASLMFGQLAICYPITRVPSFAWAKEPVEEVEITIDEGYESCPVSFTVPVAELPTETKNFRLWVRQKLRETTQEATMENGLLPWIELATAKGWLCNYVPKQTDTQVPAVTGHTARSEGARADMYILELRARKYEARRPEMSERTILASDWATFLSAVQALIGTEDGLRDLTRGEHNGAASNNSGENG